MVSIQTKTDIYIHIKTISYKRQTYICIENVMHIKTILFSSCLRSLMMLHLLSTFTRVKYHYHSIYFAKYQYYILHIESPCQCPKSALLIGPLVHHVTSWVKQPKKDGVKRPPNGLQQEVRGWRAPRLRVIASH